MESVSRVSRRTPRQDSSFFRKALRSCLIVCLLGFLLSPAANAAPVVWVLNGLTFGDGGTASGSFTYDPVTNLYSNVNITTTAGSVRTIGATYKFVCGQDVPTCNGVSPSSSGELSLTSTAADQTGLPAFYITFSPSLVNTGTVAVSYGEEANCSNAACSGPVAPIRFLTAGRATAQVDFGVRYTSNLNLGDSVINITNTGVNGAPLLGPGFGSAAGNICVNVYAFSPDEQLISCCYCLVTPNGLVSLSVQSDILRNTLTGVQPTSIVVKLLATAAGATFAGNGSTCSAASAGSTGNQLVAGMLAWGTTLHATPVAGTYATTETPFTPATLSPGELASITGRCASILGNGSGFGQCKSCRAGGLGAARQ